ncbi:integrase domain-containing protein [Silvimonas soli]|uniref:integrase domain-containing protein n=1 Tax=Silvimonas soli TaxID=2980100 RepID=UPI0024B3A320|nr:integrase domain-containing protein [Silvimonas soli]
MANRPSKTRRERKALLNAVTASKASRTKVNYAHWTNRLWNLLKERGHDLRFPEKVPETEMIAIVKIYVSRLEGLSVRSIHNQLAAIRKVLAHWGFSSLASPTHPVLNNLALLGKTASRVSTRRPCNDLRFNEIMLQAETLRLPQGVIAIIGLQRYLGLRATEALMSANSLATWLHRARTNQPLHIIYGVKGGRQRFVNLAPDNREGALIWIERAQRVAKKQHNRLMVNDRLKHADNTYHEHCRKVGLANPAGPHTLRYRWATAQLDHYLNTANLSLREAKAAVALDLGHGEGRGNEICARYCREYLIKHGLLVPRKPATELAIPMHLKNEVD